MGKKWLLILLSLVVMIGLLAVPAVAADTLASGVTDEGCPWELSADYVLYLGEEGKTVELGYVGWDAPWDDYRKNIQAVEIRGTVVATDGVQMFYNMTSLQRVDLEGLNTSRVTSMNNMFSGCRALQKLDISSFDTANVTDMSYMLSGCTSLVDLNMAGFDTSKVTNMSGMFDGCKALTALGLPEFDTSNVEDMYAMFRDCRGLTYLNISSFDTSRVESFGSMFRDCRALTEVDVSGFDTSENQDFDYMFSGCYELTKLDVSGFDTSRGTDFMWMFNNCFKLAELDVSGFDTSNALDLHGMFFGCNSLKSMDLSGWNTDKVEDMGMMFYRCQSLESLNVSNFHTLETQDVSYMFAFCLALKELDLRSFTFSDSLIETVGWQRDLNKIFLECSAKRIFFNPDDWCDRAHVAARDAGYILQGDGLYEKLVWDAAVGGNAVAGRDSLSPRITVTGQETASTGTLVCVAYDKNGKLLALDTVVLNLNPGEQVYVNDLVLSCDPAQAETVFTFFLDQDSAAGCEKTSLNIWR